MVTQKHGAKGKGYINGHPIFPTFQQLQLPLLRRFDPSENWLSSRCLTSYYFHLDMGRCLKDIVDLASFFSLKIGIYYTMQLIRSHDKNRLEFLFIPNHFNFREKTRYFFFYRHLRVRRGFQLLRPDAVDLGERLGQLLARRRQRSCCNGSCVALLPKLSGVRIPPREL